jgi:probable HAF family extracellular repeat protein
VNQHKGYAEEERKLYRGFFGFSGNSTLAVPGSNHISAQGINDFGQVVGLYYDRDAAPHGFLYSNGVYTTLNAPDSPIRRRCTPTLFPAILGLHPSRLGCIDGRAFCTVLRERYISCRLRQNLFGRARPELHVDGTFGRPGDRVIDLHFWNEQIPVTPIGGHSLVWGCRFKRSFAKSLRELAQFLMSKPELSDINIIRANINLDPLCRIAARHGFEGNTHPPRMGSAYVVLMCFGSRGVCGGS